MELLHSATYLYMVYSASLCAVPCQGEEEGEAAKAEETSFLEQRFHRQPVEEDGKQTVPKQHFRRKGQHMVEIPRNACVHGEGKLQHHKARMDGVFAAGPRIHPRQGPHGASSCTGFAKGLST